jgi:hypothetical protein
LVWIKLYPKQPRCARARAAYEEFKLFAQTLNYPCKQRRQKKWSFFQAVNRLYIIIVTRVESKGSKESKGTKLVRALSGIKSVFSLEHYLGVSKIEQKEALSWMNKQINEENTILRK